MIERTRKRWCGKGVYNRCRQREPPRRMARRAGRRFRHKGYRTWFPNRTSESVENAK